MLFFLLSFVSLNHNYVKLNFLVYMYPFLLERTVKQTGEFPIISFANDRISFNILVKHVMHAILYYLLTYQMDIGRL